MNQNEFFFVAKLLDLKKLWPKSEEFFKNESGKSIYMYGVGGQKIGFLFFFFNVLVTMQVGDRCMVVGYVLT